MRPEQPFLDAIFASPDEDAPRLLFADWLEERGDPYGEFIRVQCYLYHAETTRRPPGWFAELQNPITWCRDFQSLQARCRELMTRKNVSKWVGLKPRRNERFTFRRGFVFAATCSCDTWILRGPTLLSRHPVQQLTLGNVRVPVTPGLYNPDSYRIVWPKGRQKIPWNRLEREAFSTANAAKSAAGKTALEWGRDEATKVRTACGEPSYCP